METYTFLRELADSWVLLLMTLFFLGAVIWAFRPGSAAIHKETADIPFRNDSLAAAKNGCSKDCATCKCKALARPDQETSA